MLHNNLEMSAHDTVNHLFMNEIISSLDQRGFGLRQFVNCF